MRRWRVWADGTDLPHRGFETFKRAVDKYHPAYHIHGHVHKEYDFRFRRERQYGETTVINAWMSHILEIDMNGIHKNKPAFPWKMRGRAFCYR